MSSTIDNRVVELGFENKQFESGTKTSLDTITKLKAGLNFDESTKSLERLSAAGKSFSLGNLNGISEGVQGIASKFTALGVIGFTIIQNLTNAAIDLGRRIASAIVEPAKQGLAEYETQMNAVQTILANTSTKGTSLEQVNKALAELNAYADKTIYNFTEMTRNIGTFTAAGLSLDVSVQAIKGIANLAAVSGSNSQQASTAMYQLSQALSTGTLRLQDWNSVVNAGMGGQIFQDALKETARVHGVAVDNIIKQEGSFRESLSKGWATAEIVTETLAKFTGDLNAEQLKAIGYTETQITEILKLGQVANDAATKVKTFSQLKETLQEAIQSGWAQTWQLLIGDFTEAKTFWTDVSNIFGYMIQNSSDARNKVLQSWKDLGGRDLLIKTITQGLSLVSQATEEFSRAWSKFFPTLNGPQLMRITTIFADGFSKFAKAFYDASGQGGTLGRTLEGLFAILNLGVWVVTEIAKGFFGLFKSIAPSGKSILDFTANIGDMLQGFRSVVVQSQFIKKFFDGIPGFVSKAAEAFQNFKSQIILAVDKIREVVTRIFEKINIQPLKEIFEKVKTFLTDIFSNVDTSGVTNFFDKIGERFAPLTALAKGLGVVVSGMVGIFKKIAPYLLRFGKAIANFASEVAKSIGEALSELDFSKLFDALNAGLLGALLLAIKKFLTTGKGALGNVTGMFDSVKGILGNVSGILDGVRGSLEAFQKNLQAKTLMTIAVAIAILTGSLIALSLIDSAKLTGALLAITTVFAELTGTMAIFSKMAGPTGGAGSALALIGLSTSILILSGAVAILAKIKPEDLKKGLAAIADLTIVMIIFSKTMSSNTAGLFKASAGLALFSIALTILVSVVKRLGSMEMETLQKGLIGIGALLGELAIFMNLTSASKMGVGTGAGLILLTGAIMVLVLAVEKFGKMDIGVVQQGLQAIGAVLIELAAFIQLTGDGKNVLTTAVGVTILGAAMLIFSEAMLRMGNLSWEQIQKGLVAMAGSLLLVTAAVKAMPKDAILAGVALTIIAGSLIILSEALSRMGDMTWDEIAKGLIAMGASLLILSVGMYAMEGALPGAAALLVASAALAVLAPVLKTLGEMAIGDIGIALLALAGMFVILGVAGYALTPVVPTLLGLGVAILLLGVATLAVGAGVLAFSAGLAALAVSGTVGATAIVAIVGILLSMIPMLIKALVDGVILLAQLIAEAAPVIAEALTKTLLGLISVIIAVTPPLVEALKVLLLNLIDLIIVVVPKFIDAVLYLIDQLLKSIAAKMPSFIQSGYDILLAFMRGIRDNIGEIVTTAIEIVTNFIDAVAEKLPDIIDSGWNLIISFINGMADSIDKNGPALQESIKKLGTAIAKGIGDGITSGVGDVVAAIKRLGGAAVDALKTLLGIFSPSRVFTDLGAQTGAGFVVGLDSYGKRIENATTDLGDKAISGMSYAISTISSALDGNMNMTPTIRPVVDLTDVISGGKQVNGIFGRGISVAGTLSKVPSISRNEDVTNPDALDPKTSGPTTSISLTQNNYSPKELSRLDIYRQTRNQLLTLKGIVGDAKI